jgi:hypothetical protein
MRRSLRLASTARCSPVFGFDWSYDDAKTNGFNGSTSIYTGDFLADRNILTLAHFNEDGAIFPGGYIMPLGFPKPSWGKWETRAMDVADVHRIASEAQGYCYSSRIIYADKEHWNSDWVDLYDSNKKLWKSTPTTMMPAMCRDSVPRGMALPLPRSISRIRIRPFGPALGTRGSVSHTSITTRPRSTWTASSTAAPAAS